MKHTKETLKNTKIRVPTPEISRKVQERLDKQAKDLTEKDEEHESTGYDLLVSINECKELKEKLATAEARVLELEKDALSVLSYRGFAKAKEVERDEAIKLLREAVSLIEDVALTGEHSEDCQYRHTGKQCDCMDRHFFNERVNSEKCRAFKTINKAALAKILEEG